MRRAEDVQRSQQSNVHPAAAVLAAIGDARFFQVQLVFDAAARFVGDLALAQQLIDEFALGIDQLLLERRRSGACARGLRSGSWAESACGFRCACAECSIASSGNSCSLDRFLQPLSRPAPAPPAAARISAPDLVLVLLLAELRRPSQRTTSGSIRPCPTSVMMMTPKVTNRIRSRCGNGWPLASV